MNLRSYQNDFVSGVAKGFHSGFMRQLGVLPTGGGKTIVFAKIAQRFHEKRGERTLILAHREELIDQAAAKVQMATGIIPSVEKAARHADRTAPIVVASIQTMQGERLTTWPKDHFGLVVCDEAHHAISDQWQNTLKHFDARVLGVTATPDRGDKKSLAKYFDNLAYEIGMMKLIEEDHLAKVAVRSVPLRIDLAEVKSTGGDYDSNDLDAAITPYLAQIAKFIAEHCADRKRIVAFLPLIKTSQRFVDECVKAGIDARHIDGKSDDRKEILADYSAGKFRLLSNAMLLTEGWDEPGVDCLLVLRPTRSRGLYSQMVGRGTRTAPGKANLLLLDFLWMHEKHDLMKPACLVANTKEEEALITKALAEGDDKDLGEAITDAAEEREAALIREIAANAAKKERFIALEHVGVLLKDKKMMNYSPVFGWEKTPATEGQRRVLDKFGLKCETKGEASMVMSRLFDRSRAKMATIKQLQWLVRMKHPSPETATFAEAKSFLDEKWKKTA
jgi:superfamily II DNA or RNA helicase